jgi:hypothetical protein
MKYYPILCAALGAAVLILLASRWGTCERVDIGSAAHASTTPTEPPELLGDPPPHPECVPVANETLVIAPCIDDDTTSAEWAITSDGFVANATWEELAGMHAVAVFCEYASVYLSPYRREQTLVSLEDGLVRAPCNGAHFVHFFSP